MLGLSYTQFYRSNRGVLLLSLSTAFPTPSPVPSPSSQLCVPQLHPLTHAPVPNPLNPVPTPTPSILPLPYLLYPYPDLCSLSFLPLRRRALVPFPYSYPYLPLLYYLITCFLSCPSALPYPLSPTSCPSTLPLSPYITIAGQFITAGFLFPLYPVFSYPRFLYPYPLIPP